MKCRGTERECVKEQCENWVILYGKDDKGIPEARARCAFSWMPIILTEVVGSLGALKMKD